MLVPKQFFFPEGNVMVPEEFDVLFPEGFMQVMLLVILNEPHGTFELRAADGVGRESLLPGKPFAIIEMLSQPGLRSFFKWKYS